jgi:hypothetical protein
MKLAKKLLVVGAVVVSAMLGSCANPHMAHPALPEKEGVYFITPRDGDVVSSPVLVRFGLKGKGVAPAGVNMANTGHHHLLIDETTLPPMNVAFPSDEHHVHFGGGQTEASVKLAPGRHTLQLVLADHLHVPLGPNWVSERITITVK